MFLIRVLLAGCFLLLAGCGGSVKRINSPTASIQQLSVLADGSWQLQIRLQNFSSVGMHYKTLAAHLDLMELSAGEINVSLDMDIPGESADVVQTVIVPASSAREALLGTDNSGAAKPTEIGIAYSLKGRITISDPKHEYEFEYKSRLSPAPGLNHVYR